MMDKPRGRRWLVAYGLPSVVVTLVACSDRTPVLNSPQAQPGHPMFSLMSECGISYTERITGSDPDLEQYGIKPDTSITDVCETWTGSDYQVQMTLQYSNSPEVQASDATWTVVYSNSSLESYGASANLQDVQDVGGSSFNYVNASSDETQASYDSPYYGVYGHGWAGCPPTCLGPVSRKATDRANATPDSLGLRHSLLRRGIRYLVNNFNEIAPGPTGNRRFRGQRANMEVTFELAPLTELLVAEEYQASDFRLRGTHTWMPLGTAWVREHSDYTGEQLEADGAWHSRRSTVTFTNVTLGVP